LVMQMNERSCMLIISNSVSISDSIAYVLASSSYSFTCLVVYIAEAHAIDEWPISSPRYNQGICLSATPFRLIL
jgi:hypothetical protein